jgi:hypothetical protein
LESREKNVVLSWFFIPAGLHALLSELHFVLLVRISLLSDPGTLSIIAIPEVLRLERFWFEHRRLFGMSAMVSAGTILVGESQPRRGDSHTLRRTGHHSGAVVRVRSLRLNVAVMVGGCGCGWGLGLAAREGAADPTAIGNKLKQTSQKHPPFVCQFHAATGAGYASAIPK